MQPFTYLRAASLDEAIEAAAKPGAAIMAGGTTMIDLMRGDLAGPSSLVDIGHLDDLASYDTSGSTLRFGALARMADIAEDMHLIQMYPALAESLQLAASQQIRNAATVGGNIMQRTRCPYFRNGISECNKRVPGTGCTALDGETRDMALFGASQHCIASYPGDWGTALAAFDTEIEIVSAQGKRSIPLTKFHTLPGDHPEIETIQPGEIVTAITLKSTPAGRRSTYVKVRDRQSYAYAVVSAAVALDMDGDIIREARVSVGGVASKPWRATAAETALQGQKLSDETALAAGEAAFSDAQPQRHNAFKIELGRRTVAKATLVAGRRN